MKYRIVVTIVALLCTASVVQIWAKGGEEEAIQDISQSAIHGDLVFPTVAETEVATEEETNNGYVDSADYGNSSNADTYDDAIDNRSFREIIIDTAYELYGVSEEWTIWLIGTTHNEGYQGDRYLEYAWACEIINSYRYWSVWDLDCIWGDYYSIGNAYSGYYSADDTTLEMVYEALTDRDTRICEVDGMIRWYVEGYYLIYDSDIYNCQVWGN